ncbi:unnamed protein product, partial [Ectocarpus sp. 4 AP-2014]
GGRRSRVYRGRDVVPFLGGRGEVYSYVLHALVVKTVDHAFSRGRSIVPTGTDHRWLTVQYRKGGGGRKPNVRHAKKKDINKKKHRRPGQKEPCLYQARCT